MGFVCLTNGTSCLSINGQHHFEVLKNSAQLEMCHFLITPQHGVLHSASTMATPWANFYCYDFMPETNPVIES